MERKEVLRTLLHNEFKIATTRKYSNFTSFGARGVRRVTVGRRLRQTSFRLSSRTRFDSIFLESGLWKLHLRILLLCIIFPLFIAELLWLSWDNPGHLKIIRLNVFIISLFLRKKKFDFTALLDKKLWKWFLNVDFVSIKTRYFFWKSL